MAQASLEYAIEEAVKKALDSRIELVVGRIKRIEQFINANYVGSQWLTVNEAAKLTGVSKQTIRSLAKKGTIPSTRVGKQFRFRQADLVGIGK